jgi:Zn-dependent peptidase ImmA (M78 family)
VARRAARELLARLDAEEPPVDVHRAAGICGLSVVYDRFDGETSGLLWQHDDGTKVVGVNSGHSPARQRFTIAHEIGHALLHLGDGDDVEVFIDKPREVLFRDAVSSRATDPREIEANAFAAELLMPVALVRSTFDEQVQQATDEKLVQLLADRFGVSRTAMAYRLVNLSLMDPA